MAITGQDIATKAGIVLQDTTNVRWSIDEMRMWLNSGQREICMYKPNTIVANESMTCVAGTKQTIPAGGLQFIKAVRVTSTGVALTPIDMSILNTTIPDWHATAKRSDAVRHYAFDVNDPKTFYLYPGPATTIQVDIMYGKNPVDFGGTTTITGTLGTTGYVDEIYETALLDYVLYRAYAKDSEVAGNADRAQLHYQMFVQAMTGKRSAELAPFTSMNTRMINKQLPVGFNYGSSAQGQQ